MNMTSTAQQQKSYGAVSSEQLEIFIHCVNLPKLFRYSASDPFVVISQKNEKTNEFVELCKTEVVEDNNNPEFTKQIIIDYKFEEVQLIRFDIYDADPLNIDHLSKQNYIGNCQFILGDLVTANDSKLTIKLKDKNNKALIVNNTSSICIVRSEEIKQNNDEFIIQFKAIDLPKMGGMDFCNPYLQIYRKASDGGWMSILRTNTIQNKCDPIWNKEKIEIQRLCNGDYNRDILIKCFHDKELNEPQEMGYCITSLQEILTNDSKQLKHPSKENENAGCIIFSFKNIVRKYGILQYVMNGMQIQMIVAIDFTASNGDPRNKTSLHYCGAPKHESPYLKAIRSVGRVVEPYDSDGMIAAYGFGANINPSGDKKISHCFNLTLTDNDNDEEVSGIEGVLEAYSSCLNKIQLYGPTYFNEIIEKASNTAKSMKNNENEQNYVILLIITDGVINDMQKTIDTIVDATELALSIIIVGVGNADFSVMDKLDADDEPLKSSKDVYMKRDIVQFVPFNKFSNVHISELAKEVLEEVPGQINEYMTMNKLYPLQKKKKKKEEQDTINNNNLIEIKHETTNTSKKRKKMDDDEMNDDDDDNDDDEPQKKKRKLNLNEKNKLEWDLEEIAKWIGCLGTDYNKYIKSFKSNGITGEFMDDLDDETLTDIVSSKLHRRKILFEWKRL